MRAFEEYGILGFGWKTSVVNYDGSISHDGYNIGNERQPGLKFQTGYVMLFYKLEYMYTKEMKHYDPIISGFETLQSRVSSTRERQISESDSVHFPKSVEIGCSQDSLPRGRADPLLQNLLQGTGYQLMADHCKHTASS